MNPQPPATPNPATPATTTTPANDDARLINDAPVVFNVVPATNAVVFDFTNFTNTGYPNFHKLLKALIIFLKSNPTHGIALTLFEQYRLTHRLTYKQCKLIESIINPTKS